MSVLTPEPGRDLGAGVPAGGKRDRLALAFGQARDRFQQLEHLDGQLRVGWAAVVDRVVAEQREHGVDLAALLEPRGERVAVRDGGQPRPRSRMAGAADRGLPERVLHRLAQLIGGDQQALGPEDRRHVPGDPGGQLHERDLELLVGDRLLDPLRLPVLPAGCLRLVLHLKPSCGR
jgi:hypothetical protein